MTAAEKRARFENRLAFVIADVSNQRNLGSHDARALTDLLTFTDDPAPAPQLDWRDEVVSWGTGWEKDDHISVSRPLCGDELWFVVYEDGRVMINGDAIDAAQANNDPLSRCRLIDAFLAGLEGKA